MVNNDIVSTVVVVLFDPKQLVFVDVLSQILPNNSYKNIIFAIHNNFVKLNSGRYGCTNDISQNPFGFFK